MPTNPTWEETTETLQAPSWEDTTPEPNQPAKVGLPSSYFDVGLGIAAPGSLESKAWSEAGIPQTESIAPELFSKLKFDINPEEPWYKAAVKAASNLAVGIPEFISSPAGISGVYSGMVAPGTTKAFFAADMIKNAIQQAPELMDQWGNMTPAQKAASAVDLIGSIALGAGLTKSVVGDVLKRYAPPAVKLARELETLEPEVKPGTPAAIRQLGVRVPEGPFAQPGIPELASAALGERFQMVKPAGAPEEGALMDLRRAIEPPRVEIAQPVARAERIQGGGQAPYGKVSFMREAEAPLPERTQAALQEQAKPAISEPTPKPAEPAPVEPVAESTPPPATEAEVKPAAESKPKPVIEKGKYVEYYSPVTHLKHTGIITGIDKGWVSIINDDGAPVVQRAENIIRNVESLKPSAPTAPPPAVEAKPGAGSVVLQSGRSVSVPKLKPITSDRAAANRIRELDAWLVSTAIEDAAASGKDFQGDLFKGMNPKKLSPADRDTLNDYLFGNEKGINLQTGERIEPPQPSAGIEVKKQGAEGEPTKGIITGRAIEKWADDTLSGGATHLGPDVLAAYLVKGAALIERGIINFAEWSARMIAEHGDKVKPHLRELFVAAQETAKRAAPSQTGDLKSAREIVEQRIRAMTEGEEVKMRKSAARATESPAIPEPVQEKIETAPESFYKVQPNELVEEAVKRMSDAELVSVPAESNLFVAARLEAANRLFTAGEMDKGYQIFVELEKQGTSFGQNINQFKRLPGTLPEHTAFVINQKLKNAGKDPLTKQQEAKAIDLTKASKQSDAELDRATEAWRKDPTDANATKAQDALLKSNNAAIALQRFIGAFDPRGTASVLKSILQGNLLTPISEVANLFGNMSFLPFRAMDRSIASGLDIIDNAITGRRREVSVSPIGGTAAALGGARHGLSRVPEIMFRGTGDTIKGEKHAGLHPVRAWINQFANNPEMPTTGGKLTLKDRINLALEGTFGVPAEMMLRGLGAGDQPFKEAARARVITEQLRLKNVPQSQWAFARQFPELFFDRATMEQIKGDTLAAVFQRNSRTIGHMMNWIRGKGDLFDLALATVAPYKLTPWNLVGEILSYNPVVAFSKAALEAKRGNTRSAKLNAGKFVVGSMLTSAGWWLYQNGLLSPSLDERTEAQKARVLADQVLPPNHINISGLQRKLSGGDPTYKPGDRTVDIFRAGGLAGSIFYMTANIGRDFEKQPETQSAEHLGAIIRQSTLEQARFGLNQSFLSGVEGILTAVKDGNTDNYVRQYMNTVLSIPLPNSLATLSRATREFQPEFRAEGFGKQVENTIRNKLGFAGLDDYLPLKRGLWGEPLPQTPKGANELFYQFFDITKSRQVTDDPVPIELYRLWRKTADTRAIPSLPEKTLTMGGITYALNPEQRSRYAELVGKYRRQMADAIVINPAFHKLNDDQKLDMLDRLYREGLQTGKTFFWAEAKDKLQPKAERAGFK